MTAPLQELPEHDQSPWIDYISREFVRGGDLAGLARDGIVGLTSNPTIFQGAIADGDAYDDVVAVLERDRVEKFADSFRKLIAGVAVKRHQLVAA